MGGRSAPSRHSRVREVDPALRMAIRHDCWANLELLRFCAGLTREQLAWTSPGTYGSIHATLQHVVGAEQGYLRSLTGERAPLGPLEDDDLRPLDELIAREEMNASRIEAALAMDADPVREIHHTDRSVSNAAVVTAQFIHHGSDHRAHVGTILGAHGLVPPELGVWEYAFSVGDLRLPPGFRLD